MALEIKPSQALKLWRQVHLDLVQDAHADLSVRQTAILLTIYLELPPHTVRGLASRLGVLSFLTPLLGVGLGAGLLGESLAPGFLAGAALVLVGVVLVSRRTG